MMTRRGLAPLPFLALLPRAAWGAADLAMVMNSGEASVSVIDMGSRQVVASLPTFREPSHWCLTPDAKTLLVCDASGNAVFRFDPRTAAELGHVRIADPYQLGFTPDGKYLVVNALRINHVDFYDGVSLALVKRFSVGKMPSHLDFSPDGAWSFHSMQESGTLVSFDVASLTERWRVAVGNTPAGVLWHNGKVLVAIMGGNGVREVDPVTGALGRFVETGEGAHNLFLDAAGGRLFVSNRLGGSLTVLDPKDLSFVREYVVPGGPDDIGIDPEGKIWIALRFAEAVAVLDPLGGGYESIAVGRSPHGIFLNTELGRAGVTAERI